VSYQHVDLRYVWGNNDCRQTGKAPKICSIDVVMIVELIVSFPQQLVIDFDALQVHLITH